MYGKVHVETGARHRSGEYSCKPRDVYTIFWDDFETNDTCGASVRFFRDKWAETDDKKLSRLSGNMFHHCSIILKHIFAWIFYQNCVHPSLQCRPCITDSRYSGGLCICSANFAEDYGNYEYVNSFQIFNSFLICECKTNNCINIACSCLIAC